MGTFEMGELTDALRDVQQSLTNDSNRHDVHHRDDQDRGDTQAMPLKISTMTVDPALATKWLGYNTHNRHTRNSVISAYTDAMKNGDWRNDIDPIAFAGTLNGRGKNQPVLLNGQHRLLALCAADITLDFLVIEGLSISDQVEMDSGVKRQLADQLRLQGVAAAAEVASMLRLVYAYEQDMLRHRQGISYSTMLRYLDAHADLPEAVLPARKLYAAVGGRVSVFGSVYYIISQLNDPQVQEDLDEFFETLASGENLSVGSPILALRNQILALSTASSPRRRGPNAGQVPLMAIMFKAWNAWREGVTIQQLSWRGGGKSPEAFPIPV